MAIPLCPEDLVVDAAVGETLIQASQEVVIQTLVSATCAPTTQRGSTVSDVSLVIMARLLMVTAGVSLLTYLMK